MTSFLLGDLWYDDIQKSLDGHFDLHFDHTLYKLTSIKLAKCKIKVSSMLNYIKKWIKRKMKKAELDDVFHYELDDENWRPTYILP
jgi:hypothetical protein